MPGPYAVDRSEDSDANAREAGMARAGFFAALDRWGLLKYALATLFTVLAFTLTAGAFLLDELAKRPARPRALPAAWVERDRKSTRLNPVTVRSRMPSSA